MAEKLVQKAHGLFVGIDEYKFGRQNLHGCANDARYLSKAARPALATNNVIVNAQATRRGILDKIEQILGKSGPGDLFVFFCACHGWEKYGEFFLIPHDHDPRTFLGTALLFQDIANLMGSYSEVNTLIAIDACQSGAIGFDPANHNRGQLSSIMAAAAPLEPSLEYGSDHVKQGLVPRRHGKFAYALIQRLEGIFGDGGDGSATIAQLFTAAYMSTKEASENAQHPVMVGTLPAFLTIRRAQR